LPVGVDLAKYNFTEREAATRPPVRVLTVARLVEAKGVEYALRAIARVIARHQEIHYQIVGDGPLRERLQGLAGELEIADHVSFLGGQSQGRISRLYEEADIFVLPSIIGPDGWQEGQGLVLMEAQATGLPIISTNTGGIPESIRDGETGFLVPERDVDSLAERLCFLIEHRHLRIQMGRAGRAYVEQNYDLNKLNDELVRLYQMVIAQDAKRPAPESTSLRHR
jgi:colanic acid/amylovoran biosynthesis glycosyltransferase